MEKYKHALEIREYNKYLIITLIDKETPKLQFIGSGLLLSKFNFKDVLISPEALNILISNIGNKHQFPALEVLSKDKIWWAGKKSLIIPPNELMNVFVIPSHSICDNNVDEKIKEQLK